MITVLSPSKSLDFSDTPVQTHTQPEFLDQSKKLVQQLKKYSREDIKELMSISDNLADLNYQRFHDFKTPFDTNNAKQALLSFTGDVYTGFDLENYDHEDLQFAQNHLRILSGLYGILKPLDLIQPYRLEMGTRLDNPRGKDLYEFWGNQIGKKLSEHLENTPNNYLVNLASNEYWKAVDQRQLNQEKIITPVFKEHKDGGYKVVAIYAKKARGMMANYIIKYRINEPEQIKSFQESNYMFNQELSSENEWVFTR